MSVSEISSNGSGYESNMTVQTHKQQRQDFGALSKALGSGDLAGAQKAFAALQQDMQKMQQTKGAGSQAGQNSAVKTDMDALASALNSGDVSGAQKAFAAVQQDMKNAHKGVHHHGSAGGNVANAGNENPAGDGFQAVA